MLQVEGCVTSGRSVCSYTEQIYRLIYFIWASQVAQRLKKKKCLQCKRLRFDPWVGKIALEEEMATHSCSYLEYPMDIAQ